MDCVTIRRGDTLVYGARPNVLDTTDSIGAGWVCRVGLYEADGTEAIAPVDVTLKLDVGGSEHFVPYLSRVQTKALDAGVYEWVIDVRNDSLEPPYSDECSVQVTVVDERIVIP